MTTWGLKFYTFERDLNKINQTQDSDLTNLSISGRNIFAAKDFSIFKSFPKLKSLDIKEHLICN